MFTSGVPSCAAAGLGGPCPGSGQALAFVSLLLLLAQWEAFSAVLSESRGFAQLPGEERMRGRLGERARLCHLDRR